MPIYSYECTNKKCNHQFDKLVPKVTEESTACPKCSSLAKQIISVPSPFQWGKGGGWNR